nr:hypothetical protein [uncultured Nocardioides sp.]
MPVEDRLRQGLEANATSFSPQGESRLRQVHRQRRRHNAALAASLGVAAALLAAVAVQVAPGWSPGSTPPAADDCSPVRGHTAPKEDTMDKRTIAAAVTVAALASACDPAGGTSHNLTGDPERGASSTTVPTLPEHGGWVREVTAKRGRALGVPARTVRRLVGDDGVLPLGFKLHQGTFTIWTNDDDFEATAWDFGNYRFKRGHVLVLTTVSDTCPSCATSLAWHTIGNDVVFDSVDRTRYDALAEWLWQGRWQHQE